jgi:type 1 glutamine amidotransferase
MRSNLILHRCWLHHVFFVLFFCGPAFAETKPGPRRIVFIAGPITGHPKEAHEYEKSVILLKHLLDTSPNLKNIETEAHFKGWPEDPSTLDNADTIVMISDGCDRKETDHPLYVGDRWQVIEKQMKRGCGFVQFHWTTFNPSRFHDKITEWSGGYFDYETGTAPNKWSSAIQTWTGPVTLGTPQHPIARGVKPFQVQEEFYYQIRFRENDPRLKPILLTRPPGVNQDHVVGWAVQRNDGGRGFGFTGGHFYKNWWLPDFRKLILNAIVWTAGIDVPEGGVESDAAGRIKALVLTGYHHPAHDWRAVTAALIVSLEQDPRMIVQVTENIEDLATKLIHDYDLLVMNYNNWDTPGLSEAAKANFVNYLKKGGGLAVIHFANGAFTDTLPNKESDWPEYRTKIVRRIWDHRPGKSGHDPFGPFQVEITAGKHPITQGLKSFPTMDELYFLQAGELPIEPLATAHSKVTNQEEPMAWAYNYEAGRVFQTVLGHADQSIRMAAALIRRGSVWAAGRSQISFDPPINLTEGVLFRDGSPWTIEKSLTTAGDKKKAQAPISPAPITTNAAAKPVLPANPGLDEGGKYGHWGAEGEKDWVDNRWSRMDTGPFFSSSLQTPSGIALKALSIRVGEHEAAAVCFDTGQLSLKAGWTGKFIEPSPQRFGVIQMPRIGGEIQFQAPEGPGWEDAPAHYDGLHLNGKRVVLNYTVGETKVLESPWFESVDDVQAFTRTLEHSASSVPHCLQIAEVKGAQGVTTQEDGYSIVSLEKDSLITAASVVGDSGPTLKVREQSRIVLEFPSHNGTLRCKLFVWTGEKKNLSKFVGLVKQSSAPDDLTALSRAGPQRWPEIAITRGLISSSKEPYVIDTLTVPYKNQNNALMFLSGHDFLDNGDAAICTLHGDVWLVSGIDEKLDHLRWKRFATGLYQPLGLKVLNHQIYVLGRDQITRLHDLNGDGEADFYESFYNHIKTSSGGHDFVTCLETDAAGNFYYADPHGLHRVSADGSSADTLATGWRNPNGLSVGPDGTITVAPQEGEWTPASQISEVRRGGFYGFGGPQFAPDRPLGYDPPLCWIPRHIDNSSGGQVWATSNRWGPLKDQLLTLSFGKCSLMLVLRENAGGQPQGGVVPMKGRFPSGVIRGRFNPRDGQLYVTGLNGWVTSAVTDGCFSRVRYTGKPVYLPSALHIHSNGLELTFTEPLNRAVAEDGESYGIQQWNYKWSAEYGSKEYSVKFPDLVGHDPVECKSARLSRDGRTVFLEIPAMTPVMQMAIKYNLEAADGELIKGEIYNTINRLGSPLDMQQFTSLQTGK